MTKSELRILYKKKRQSLSNKDIEKLSVQIFDNFRSNFSFEAKSISIFLPIKRFKEVNTWHFFNHYKAQYYLPVVKKDKLSHIKYQSPKQLKLSDWGILEPQFGDSITPDLFDVVLIPLLAYDQLGNRIGYGKGFYDSFLKDCKKDCQFIGLSYFEPELEIINTIPSDIKLHYCITPNKIFHFR